MRTSSQCWCSNNACERSPLTQAVAHRIANLTMARRSREGVVPERSREGPRGAEIADDDGPRTTSATEALDDTPTTRPRHLEAGLA